MNKKTIIFILIIFTNAWIWRIFGNSLLLGVSLVTLSFLLVFKYKISSLILLGILGIFLLKSNFDANFVQISSFEKTKIEHRNTYYTQGLGRIYANRIGIYLNYSISPYLSRFSRNLAYNLDPNLYFFAGHPRERGNAVEFEKFSFYLLPVFAIGIISLFSGTFGLIILYFLLSLFITALASPGFELGPILLFPFITAVLYMGTLRVLKRWI